MNGKMPFDRLRANGLSFIFDFAKATLFKKIL
jgi:hypothetical protein